VNDNALSGSEMGILTGPRIDLAICLIDRMKRPMNRMKIGLDEDPDYERAIARYKSERFRNWENSPWMKVIPVNFHTHHKQSSMIFPLLSTSAL
jgi:hypothetical protein